MMGYVQILTKQAITEPIKWPVIVIGIVGILFSVMALILTFLDCHRFYDKITCLFVHSAISLPLMLITMLICTIFFQVETGHYKYSGVLEPEMTIVEFTKFQETYTNIEYKEGIWYWEDIQ